MTRPGHILAPRVLRLLLTGVAVLTVAACSSKDPDLMRFRNTTDQPDEFTVVPARPLEAPSDTSVLPTPTPGSGNRADQTPITDAIAALGGSPAVATRSGIPSGDSAIVSYAGRFGTDPAIRDQLAEEDLALRTRRLPRPFESVTGANVYYRTYERFLLDQQAEIERLRTLGVRVPTAPPKELKPR